MPDVIQIIPEGLLRFLGVYSGGENPSSVGKQIQPVTNVIEYYENAQELRVTDNVSIAAGGALGEFAFSNAASLPGVCPQDETWHILAYSIRGTIPAAVTACRIQPTVQVSPKYPGGAPVQFSVIVGPPVDKTASALSQIITAAADRPFWVPPGGVLGGITLSLDPLASAFNVFSYVRMVRYKR